MQDTQMSTGAHGAPAATQLWLPQAPQPMGSPLLQIPWLVCTPALLPTLSLGPLLPKATNSLAQPSAPEEGSSSTSSWQPGSARPGHSQPQVFSQNGNSATQMQSAWHVLSVCLEYVLHTQVCQGTAPR